MTIGRCRTSRKSLVFRVSARTGTEQDKAGFFRLLALTGNASNVATDLGFVQVTCFKWAHQAGIFTGKGTRAQRA